MGAVEVMHGAYDNLAAADELLSVLAAEMPLFGVHPRECVHAVHAGVAGGCDHARQASVDDSGDSPFNPQRVAACRLLNPDPGPRRTVDHRINRHATDPTYGRPR